MKNKYMRAISALGLIGMMACATPPKKVHREERLMGYLFGGQAMCDEPDARNFPGMTSSKYNLQQSAYRQARREAEECRKRVILYPIYKTQDGIQRIDYENRQIR